jgi:hypothetical protein
MGRSQRVRIDVKGDLSEALLWEAERREMKVQDLGLKLLESACSTILTQWREVRDMERGLEGRPKVEEVLAVRSVLAKAYGPFRRRRRPSRGRRRARA